MGRFDDLTHVGKPPIHKPSATSSVSPAVPADQPAPKPSEPEKYSQQPATPAREMHTASPSHQQPSHPSTDQSINQSTNRSTNQLIDRLTDQLTHRYTNPDDDKVMNKPRAFYITERLNKLIDEGVRYYQEKHGFKKVDRSIVVTALLDNEAIWTEEVLDAILDKVISHLTSRLTSR